jgi:hypothetical protein
MLGFFLFARRGVDAPGLALVDVLQAPHSVLLSRLARTLEVRPPTLLYRRLFRTQARPGRQVIATEPTFELYQQLADRHGLPGWIQVHLIDVGVVTPVIDVIRPAATGHNGGSSSSAQTFARGKATP